MGDQTGSAGFCGQCGAPLVPGAKFCGKCGATVAAAAEPPVTRGVTPLEKLPLDPPHLHAEDTFDEATSLGASGEPTRIERLVQKASAYQEIRHYDPAFGLDRCDSFFVDGRGTVVQARDLLMPAIKQNLDIKNSLAAPFQVEAMEVPADGRPCIRVISLGPGVSPVVMGTYFILFDSQPDGIAVYVINSHGTGYYAAKGLIDGKVLGQDDAEALCSCARISSAMTQFGLDVYYAVMFAVGNLNRNLFKNQG